MTVDMKALKEAAGKATHGPWGASGLAISASGTTNTFSGPVYGTIAITEPCMQSDEDGRVWSTNGDAEENAHYIALANPSTILSLIERCEELEGALSMLRNTAGDLKNGFAPFVEPSRWVDQFQAVADAALSKADATS